MGDSRIMRDCWRQTFACLLSGHPRTAWSNARFLIGMWVGGFKKASRDS